MGGGNVITERKWGQKLKYHLFFTVLYWRPVVHVCCDHRPWLNPAVCECECESVCNRALQVCTNSAGLKQERWHFWVTTGEIRLQTVLSVPVLCASQLSLGRWIQSSHQGVPTLCWAIHRWPPSSLPPSPRLQRALSGLSCGTKWRNTQSLQMALQRFGSDLFATACKLHLRFKVLTT